MKPNYSIEELNFAFEVYSHNIFIILNKLIKNLTFEDINDLDKTNVKIKELFQIELGFNENLMGLDSFLADAFNDVFTFFLLHKNYNFDENFIIDLIQNWMFSGNQLVYNEMSNVDFFKMNYNTKINYLLDLKLELERRNIRRAKCPFYNSVYKEEFINLTWDYVEIFLNLVVENFNYQLNQFIILANQGDDRGKIALFHLGLLGKYERGELT